MSVAHRTKERLGPGSAGIVMTPREFDAARFLPHFRYELINGVLIVSPPAADAEADPNDELGYLLRLHRDSHPAGSTIDDTMPERTIPTTIQRRRADRVIWTGLGRTPDTQADVPEALRNCCRPLQTPWRHHPASGRRWR